MTFQREDLLRIARTPAGGAWNAVDSHFSDKLVMFANELLRQERTQRAVPEVIGMRLTYVPKRGKKGVSQVTVWGPADMEVPGVLRVIEETLLCAAPSEPLPSCRWPTCQSEAKQQNIAAQVHVEIYGEPVPQGGPDLKYMRSLAKSLRSEDEMDSSHYWSIGHDAADYLDKLARVLAAPLPDLFDGANTGGVETLAKRSI